MSKTRKNGRSRRKSTKNRGRQHRYSRGGGKPGFKIFGLTTKRRREFEKEEKEDEKDIGREYQILRANFELMKQMVENGTIASPNLSEVFKK